jgi:general secretion pathway protein C
MNKRLPILLSLLGVILLAASIAYWILQFVQPPQRPQAAVAVAQMPDPPIDAAATLFGGQMAVASATSYQLTGIVAAGRNSVAIIVADGAAKALRVGKELTPGVTLAEVYPRYVMLSDNGALKRVDLPADSKGAVPLGSGAPNMTPPGIPNNAGSAAPIMPSPVAPAGNVVAEPPQSPGAVSQQVPFSSPGDVGQHDGPPSNPNASPNAGNNPNQNQNQNPNNAAPAPVQMAPPTRAIGVPANPSPALQ